MEGKGIIIPNTVQSMINAFGFINIPRLYFEDSTNTPNVGGMFGGNEWAHTSMYIYCNNAAPFLNANLLNKDSTTPLNNWRETTNGYKYTFPSNSMRSIYLYTNYSPS